MLTKLIIDNKTNEIKENTLTSHCINTSSRKCTECLNGRNNITSPDVINNHLQYDTVAIFILKQV